MKYKKHIFICTNEKINGNKFCGKEHGLNLVSLLKQKLIDDNLNSEIRVQQSGCLGVCSKGPAMVSYLDGTFYGNVQESDTDELYESHIKKNVVVDRLKITFD